MTDEVNNSITAAENPATSEAASAANGASATASSPILQLSARHRLIYHISILLVSWIVIGLSITMSVQGTTEVCLPNMQTPLPELCMTRRLFRVPCPGCGMTRAFISIGHGAWKEAWFYNPVSFLAYFALVAQTPWRLMQLRRLSLGKPDLEPLLLNTFLVVFVVLLLSQWLFRMVV